MIFSRLDSINPATKRVIPGQRHRDLRMEFGSRNAESGNGKEWNSEFVGSQSSHGHTQTHTDIFLPKVYLSVFV